MDKIMKDVYVTRKGLPVRVSYVQATNAVPIVLEIRDYTVPSGATAQVFVKKPSGKEVYNAVSLSGNTVTITPTVQMVMEPGEQEMQVEIISGEKTLVTFPMVLDVSHNLLAESDIESTDEYGVLQKLISDANAAISGANSAKEAANTAASGANAAKDAADTATEAASSAAEAANAAKNAANTAATAANEAADAANEATAAANTAAARAEKAAENIEGLIDNTRVTNLENDVAAIKEFLANALITE